jgi:hypothetical protein
MSLRRAGRAIWLVEVTTVLAGGGGSVVKAPPGTSLMSPSPTGGGSSRFIATFQQEDLKGRRATLCQQADAPSAAFAQSAGRGTAGQNSISRASLPPASTSPFPQTERKTPAVREAVFFARL